MGRGAVKQPDKKKFLKSITYRMQFEMHPDQIKKVLIHTDCRPESNYDDNNREVRVNVKLMKLNCNSSFYSMFL